MVKKTYTFTDKCGTVDVYTLTNARGMQMEVSTLGGRILTLTAPDRDGRFADVLMGLARPEDYVDNHPYYGAFIGRYGNRIGGAKFTLGGKTYELEKNNGKNMLHGGFVGFDRRLMTAKIDGEALVLSYHSPDGECGFPGNLDVDVKYELTDDGEVKLTYDAVSDADTLCNLTNHAYFNIGDDDTVLDQVLDINASRITPVDDELIPHGEFMDVIGTPYSFKGGVKLGKNMFSDDHMIALCHGFDFNYCLDRKTENDLEFCASVYDEKSGRYMECYTTLPGVQLYTSNTVKGSVGKKTYENYAALCLETQGFPNSPNCPEYPSTVLKKGEKYHTETVYKFSVK
ncbi:MAG TPA: galactose-1-epimerase [Clostridiales bacterium]|nr:galactose-1-epimerase [Clostridiales bacterium]